MNDDAEFEVFLKGEGDLARALQGVPQPSPSAALDAAILGRIRTSMEQQQGAAANDPGEGLPAPRLARGLGMRWRVPAGIAASALVGLFAMQAYQSNVSGDLVSAPAQERAADAILSRESAQPPAAPPPEVVNAVEPEAVADAVATPRASEPVAAVAKPRAESGRAAAAPRHEAPAKPAAIPSPIEPAAPVLAAPPPPAPAPAPVVIEAADKEAAFKAATEQQSRLYDEERRRTESKALERNFRFTPPAAPAPAPAAEASPPVSSQAQATNAAGASAAPILARERVEKVTVTGSSIKRTMSATPATPQLTWIERIEGHLRDGKDAEALREWTRFRETYPDYRVPAELEEKMKALAEQG